MKSLLLLLIDICFSCNSFFSYKTDKKETVNSKIETILIGKIIGRPEIDTILLVKPFEDARNDVIDSIPIVDQQF